jgi:thioredoxin 1
MPLEVIKKDGPVVYFTCRHEALYDRKNNLFLDMRRISMAIVTVSDQSFKSEVEGTGTVLVDFWAPWCGPCKMIAPILEELDKELSDLKIAKLNVDDNPEAASRFGVMSIPTLIVFKDGQPVDKIVGFQSKDALKNVVARHQ